MSSTFSRIQSQLFSFESDLKNHTYLATNLRFLIHYIIIKSIKASQYKYFVYLLMNRALSCKISFHEGFFSIFMFTTTI